MLFSKSLGGSADSAWRYAGLPGAQDPEDPTE
jgi:hypothetical protein